MLVVVEQLVNCAGVAHRGTAVGTRLRVLAEVMRVNFMGQVSAESSEI